MTELMTDSESEDEEIEEEAWDAERELRGE
jgi:hypothetical protein